jgi:hypothetical protein
VDTTGANGAAHSLRDVFNALGPRNQDVHIVVRGEITEPSLLVLNFKNLTIESEPGKPFTWKCPQRIDPDAALLRLNQADGFTLKGCTLDGGGRADFLVSLYNRCPGLTLEDVRLTGFKKYGINVTNAEGSPERPVTFRKLHFVTTLATQAGMFFNILPNIKSIPKNDHFTILDCDFVGPGAKIRTPNPALQDHLDIKPPLPITSP